MKKKLMTLVAFLCVAVMLAGCGAKAISNDKITIKQYKGLEVTIPEYEMSDAEFESCKASDMQTIWEEVGIKDRAAEKGDVAVIGYVGKKDGVAFEGGTAELYFLELGSGSFIPGFEDGIVGKTPSEETFDLNLTFPETYQNNPDLAGKAVVFTVTLKAILPEFSEEYIPLLTADKCKTLDEYRKMREEEAAKSYEESLTEENKEARLQGVVWEAVIENSVVANYPQDELDDYVNYYVEMYKYYASMYQMEYDAFCQQQLGMTSEELNTQLTQDAKSYIAQQYAVELIAETEKMTISEKLYEEKLAEYAKNAQNDDVKAFEEEAGEDNIKKNILYEMVTELITENCVQVEEKVEDK